MPTYEYSCHTCKSVFLKFMSFKEYEKLRKKSVPCPHCKSPSKRNFSVPSIEFKGKGFYVNDSKKK